MSKLRQIIQEEIERLLEAKGTPDSIKSYVDKFKSEYTPAILDLISQMKDADISSYSLEGDHFEFELLDERFPLRYLFVKSTITLDPTMDGIEINGGIKSDLIKGAGPLGTNMVMNIVANPEVSESDVDYELDSFLTHEITHIYEKFKRGGDFGNKNINQGIQSVLSSNLPAVWKELLHNVYETFDHEVNARVSQVSKKADLLRQRGMGVDYILSQLKGEEEWKILNKLEDFSTGQYVAKINSFLRDKGYDKQGITYEGFIKHYRGKFNELLSKGDITPREQALISKTNNLDPLEFIQFWENEFKKEAENYKRRMLKAIGTK